VILVPQLLEGIRYRFDVEILLIVADRSRVIEEEVRVILVVVINSEVPAIYV
jgi:hypothetical protein